MRFIAAIPAWLWLPKENKLKSLLNGALIAALMIALNVPAQQYPTRPIRLIVPAPPGGSTDLFARVIGTRLGTALGKQVVVDNRPGAGGIVGTDMLAKAVPDGHTIAVVYTTHTVNPSLQRKLPYDPILDFAPITIVASAPLVLVVHPDLPVRSVKDLIDLARSKPLVYGSAGNGSGGHLSGELLKMMTGIQATHVPYKGAGPAATDVAAGQLHFQFAAQITVQGFVKSGRLRAVAVTSARRAASLPDVPTVAESGLPGFEVINWFGFLAPAHTPPAIVNRLRNEMVTILKLPEVREKLASEGSETVGNTPDEFAAFLKQDIAKWAKVVKAAGMKAD
jgi:tripartite-type tricarboxylate transporter receptor subunit TctC